MKKMMKKISKYLVSIVVLLTFSTAIFSQEVTVTGNVTSSEDGSALPGVTVVEKGTTRGTTTNYDGDYSIAVSSGDAILVFSFIGMEAQEVSLNGRTGIDVVLQTSILAMDEVVATALGISMK